MKVGDCFIHISTCPGKDEEIVISCIDRIMGLCLTTDVTIRAVESPSEYIDISRHTYSIREIECFRHFPSQKAKEVIGSIHSIYKECYQLLSSSMSAVGNHKTQENDCYCKLGWIEYVIGYVTMFRPSWNVDYIWFDKSGYTYGHYRFGVDADKYNKAPREWNLADKTIYNEIICRYEDYIKSIRRELVCN